MAMLKTLIVAGIFLQFCNCKIWKDVGKTLRFSGASQHSDYRKNVFTIDALEEMSGRPNAELKTAKMAFEEARKRAKRSASGGTPTTNYVCLNFFVSLFPLSLF